MMLIPSIVDGELATGVSWTRDHNIYSVGDDKKILCSNLEGSVEKTFLEVDYFPTNIDWQSSSGQDASQLLAIAASDGE